MKTCPECRGLGKEECVVCNGTGIDPRDGKSTCSYCNGRARNCVLCGGSGQIDDNDDYRA